ncbi:hypothetical protein LTS18_013761 [Coniosporium uncinatum]|uniref:Uncharacterized protein n=1 Tax=Coniosporium uncinatum TaxID=93489 RepID=A0ACC3DVJ6_9PEZI|nr:hypothetical protein LTS18_013761 [Coniosporium uncinatum]
MDISPFVGTAASTATNVPQRRKKMATYGKATRRPLSTLHAGDSSPEAPKKTEAVPTKGHGRLGVSEKSTNGTSKGKLVRPDPTKAVGTASAIFDVPSSDEDDYATVSPARRKPAPTSRDRSTTSGQISGVTSPGNETASDATPASKKRKRGSAEPEVQLQQELDTYVRSTIDTNGQEKGATKGSRANRVRQAAGGFSQKNRLQNKKAADGSRPRPVRNAVRDIVQETKRSPEGSSSPRVVIETRSPHKPVSRPGRSRPHIKQGLSAPASLQQMLSTDDEQIDERSRRQPLQLPSTPPRSDPMDLDESDLPDTPPQQDMDPAATPTPIESVTPRQHKAWSGLLGSTATDSPSKLGMSRLRIRGASSSLAALARSSSDIPQTTHTRYVRLVDTLKENAPIDDEDGSSELDSELQDSSQAAEQIIDDPADIMEVDAPKGPVTQAGPRFTYSQQRSYLQESNPGDEMFDFLMPSPEVPKASQHSSKNVSQSQSTQNDSDQEESQGAIRSVHELKAAGGNVRFVDDFEHLLNDVQDRSKTATSRRRSAILELATKFIDKTYVGRMIDQGLDVRLIKACEGLQDTIFNFTFLAGIAFIADAGVSLSALRHIHRSECMGTITALLDVDTDIKSIAKDRKSNMSKVAQGSVGDFRGIIQESAIWTDKPEVVSPRVVALKSLELLVRKMREAGSSDELLAEPLITKLISIDELNLASAPTSAPQTLFLVELALSTLESGSVTSVTSKRKSSWTPSLHKRLVALLPPLLTSSTNDANSRIEPLALRLTLNLTNNNPRVCDIFAAPALIADISCMVTQRFDLLRTSDLSDEARIATVDRLILTLGALINLAEFSDRARSAVLLPTSDNNGDHNNDAASIPPSPPVNGLVTAFRAGRDRAAEADSLESSHINVAHGYLAVLLGNLCQNDEVRREVRRQLPGQRLDGLVEAVEEFILYHRKVDMEGSFEGEEGKDMWICWTERLGGVVGRLREV